MDLLIYCGILLIIGLIKVNATASVSDDVGVADVSVVEVSDLPVGSNLMLKREIGAYTLILHELGLVR